MSTAPPDIKQRHRAMWASGDFPSIAEWVAPLSEHMVRAAGIQAGQRVLDVGGGTGTASLAAARLGADVVCTDLTPELLDIGREAAQREGLDLTFETADAEALQFEDASFDVVMSSLGAMFAPRHEVTAAELLRVTKPGGVVAMANWTPEGLVGQMFALMKPYAPPPPPGGSPPPLWGSEDHVRSLFGDGLSDLKLERHVLDVDVYETPREAVDDFAAKYGPTIALLNHLGSDPERKQEFMDKYYAFAEEWNKSAEGEPARFDYEYLIVVGKRA
ncbi:MAG TPA: class I SAM-dependent methyltransferase [Solirubrobacteraceae bacterium]|jgi:ubiquinone/menaquinone biosynthesis C-methylase UbiE